MRFKEFLDEARDHETIIKALRSKTVDKGATPEEAKSAASKADELEKRHNIKQQAINNRPQRKVYKQNAHRNNWTDAQWKAHLDAMERDDR